MHGLRKDSAMAMARSSSIDKDPTWVDAASRHAERPHHDGQKRSIRAVSGDALERVLDICMNIFTMSSFC